MDAPHTRHLVALLLATAALVGGLAPWSVIASSDGRGTYLPDGEQAAGYRVVALLLTSVDAALALGLVLVALVAASPARSTGRWLVLAAQLSGGLALLFGAVAMMDVGDIPGPGLLLWALCQVGSLLALAGGYQDDH